MESKKVSVGYMYLVTEPKLDFRTFRDTQVASAQLESPDVHILLSIIEEKEGNISVTVTVNDFNQLAKTA